MGRNMKKCTNCKEEKTIESFYKDSSRTDGREFICKDCRKQKKKKVELNRNQEEFKTCGVCNNTKKIKGFYAGRSECKECTKNNRNKRYKENPDKQKKLSKKYRIKNKEKYLEYGKRWREENKDYEKEYNKKKWKENKKELSILNKKYRAKYRDILNEYNRKYYRENKQELIRKNTEYQSKRIKTDPVYRAIKSLRCRTSQAFKGRGWSKSKKNEELLGCDFKKAISHIESQFTEGMTWDNHGFYGWHIDHIIPLSSGETIKQVKELCHYTNLQPLWAKDNFSKGNKKEGEWTPS